MNKAKVLELQRQAEVLAFSGNQADADDAGLLSTTNHEPSVNGPSPHQPDDIYRGT